jgi:phosphopantetheinyl transferase
MSVGVSVALLQTDVTAGAEPLAAARGVLGEILGCPPEELSISRGRNGKPELTGKELHFSVAERDTYCVVATSPTHPVGVEVVRMAPPPRVLVDAILPASARNQVINAPPITQRRIFALWWSRIEAAVKACAAGLDEVENCLALAPQQVGVFQGNLVIAVACRTDDPFDVRWPVGVQAVPSPLEIASDPGLGVAM